MQKSMITVEREMTENEKVGYYTTLCTRKRVLSEMKDEFRKKKEYFRSQVKKAQMKIDALNDKLVNGKVSEEVTCTVVTDVAANVKKWVRDDTGEVVKTEPC